jgi:hypothetical protein
MALLSMPVTRVLSEIKAEHKALTSLAARLSIAQITERPGGQWSAVDLINHITAWQANALKVAQLAATPDAPPIEPDLSAGRILGIDADRFNADLLVRHQDGALDEALAWHYQVHTELLTALLAVPPDRLFGGPGPHGASRWYAVPAITHSRAHRLDFERRYFPS